jgi:hypothetical protein
LQALAAAGLQPPAGFKMANKKRPVAKTQSQPAFSQANQAEFDNDWQNYKDDIAAIHSQFKQPRAQAAAQSAAPMSGMGTGMDVASNLLNNQEYASLQKNPAMRSAASVANEEKLSKSVNSLWEAIARVDEGGLSNAIKAAKSFSRGLINRTNPILPPQGGKFQSTTQLQKDANKLGRAFNKNAGSAATGIAGGTAGMVGNDNDDPTNLPPNDLQKPAGYYSDAAANNRMVGATADAARNALASGPTTTPDIPAEIKYQPPGEVHANPIQQPAGAAGQTGQAEPVKDPGIEKIQQDLKNKGYDIKVDGILGPETEQMIAYDKQFGADYAAKQNAELSAPVSESVTFGQEISLARLIQLSR